MKVAIVGAGISGLATAYYLKKFAAEAGQPMEVLLLEASDAPGGKIRSIAEQRFVVETGPHGFLDKEPEVFKLIDELNLTPELISARAAAAKRYIVRGGKLRQVPGTPQGFLGSDILSFASRLRVGMEPLSDRMPGGEESVWAFAARRIGEDAANILVDAMVTGIYGGDPKALSLQAAFPRMHELESRYGSLVKAMICLQREKKAKGETVNSPAGAPAGTMHSFRGGLGMLTGHLASRLDVRCRTQVTGFRRLKDSGFRLQADDGVIDADKLVFTVPAPLAGRWIQPHHHALGEAIGSVPYADIAVVVQCYDAKDLRPGYTDSFGDLDGFGHLTPDIEMRPVLGSIWASSVFNGHAPFGKLMFRSLVGGARHPERVAKSDETLFDWVKQDLVELVKLKPEAEPIMQHVIRWPAGIPQYNLGHQARVVAADAIESVIPGLYVSGNGFRGLAMLNCVVEAKRLAARVLSGEPPRP